MSIIPVLSSGEGKHREEWLQCLFEEPLSSFHHTCTKELVKVVVVLIRVVDLKKLKLSNSYQLLRLAVPTSNTN